MILNLFSDFTTDINLVCNRAVAPTPAGQAMARPVFSLHLAGLTLLSRFTGPVITAFA